MGSYIVVGGGGSSTNTSGTQAGNGANDLANYSGGTAYFATDWMGDSPWTIGTLGSGAAAQLGVSTPGGVVTVPSGFSVGDFDNRPGIGFVSTSALNDVAFIHAANTYHTIYPGAPAHTLTAVFCTPKVASNATDRYFYSAGWFGSVSSQAQPYHGYAISYVDNVNSGNWVFTENVKSGTPKTTVNTSFAFVPNKWYRITMTIINKLMTLNITDLASGTTTNLFTNTTSVQLQTNNMPVPILMGGLQINRTAFGSGTIGGLIDYSSVYITGISRT